MKKIMIMALIAMTLSTGTSCMKKQDLDNEDLGPAVAPMEFTKTLAAGYGTYDYNLIKPGEVNSIVTSVKVQDNFSQVLEKQVLSVESSKNLSDRLVLTLQVTKEIFSGGQSSSSTTLNEITISKIAEDNVKTLTAESELPVLLFHDFIGIIGSYCREQSTKPTSCHRLISQDLHIKVPASEASHHNCPDANNCTISAKKIDFDMLIKFSLDENGKPRRNHYSLILSPETPFMSRVLQLCERGLHKFANSNQSIVADVCYTVDNYTFGQ